MAVDYGWSLPALSIIDRWSVQAAARHWLVEGLRKRESGELLLEALELNALFCAAFLGECSRIDDLNVIDTTSNFLGYRCNDSKDCLYIYNSKS